LLRIAAAALIAFFLLGIIIRMSKNLVMVGLSFVFLSCLSIESKISLAANGSGTVELVYTVSSFAQEFDSSGGEDSLPLPVSEADFRRGVAVVGLSLNSYSQSVSGDVTIIRAVLGFSSLDDLNRFVAGPGEMFSLRQEEGRTVFEQVITQGTKSALDGQTQEFIRSFFAPYSLAFSLSAPRAISKVSPGGNFSGTQASVSFPLTTVLLSAQPVVWRVEW
jgi:hypothetical protein